MVFYYFEIIVILDLICPHDIKLPWHNLYRVSTKIGYSVNMLLCYTLFYIITVAFYIGLYKRCIGNKKRSLFS